MTAETRTLPLTTTMRAALQGWTNGRLRRALTVAFLIVALFGVVFTIVALSGEVGVGLAIAVPCAVTGLFLLIMGGFTLHEGRKIRHALQAGVYASHTGGLGVRVFRFRSTASWYLHVGDARLLLDSQFATMDHELLATLGWGTVLYIPGANLPLVVWDSAGLRLYTAPDYDLDGDREVARPEKAEPATPFRNAVAAAPPSALGRLIGRSGLWIGLGVLLLGAALGLGFGDYAGGVAAGADGKGVYALTFSPDGRYIATGGNDRVARLWDTATGEEVRAFEPKPNTLVIRDIAFSPDGTLLAIDANVVTIWEIATGRQVQRLDASGPLQFTPDGRELLTGGARWAVGSWQRTALPLDGKRADFFSADGRLAGLTVYPTGRPRAIEIRDLASGALRATVATPSSDGYGGYPAARFSPDGRWLVVGHANRVTFYDTATGQADHGEQVRNSTFALVYAPNGATVASAHPLGDIRQWDAASAAPRTTIMLASGYASYLAYSPDGATLAVATGRQVLLYDAATGGQQRALRRKAPGWPF